MAQNKPTPAAAWVEPPELVTLPSGKKARLREKINLYPALRAGVITIEQVEDWHATQRGELRDPARALALQDAMVAWLFVEPQCVLNGDKPDGAISVQDLEDDDLDFLIARALGGVPAEDGFPAAGTVPGDAGGAEAGADGGQLAQEPERDDGSRAGDARSVPRRQPPGRKAAGARKRGARAK